MRLWHGAAWCFTACGRQDPESSGRHDFWCGRRLSATQLPCGAAERPDQLGKSRGPNCGPNFQPGQHSQGGLAGMADRLNRTLISMAQMAKLPWYRSISAEDAAEIVRRTRAPRSANNVSFDELAR